MPRAEKALALGLLQGPTELLPISSSAHIGLLLGDLQGAARKEFEVALHAGTALALLGERPRVLLALLATAPAAAAGLAFERPIEERLGTPPTVAAGLVLGALALLVADRAAGERAAADAGAADALWLGLAQAAALMPGVSRSGAVRAAARARGFGRPAAAALARELAVPVMVGAAALKGVRLAQRRPGRDELAMLAAGAAGAAVSTAAALRLDRAAGRVPLAVWAAYRVVLAALIAARADRPIRENRRR
jgi:undecaprenyl-diphosphatase